MEWLSHSQKKYCELCKTSFRFTKLYHPGMPSRIPTAVFIRRAAIHVLKMLVTWCRGALVASVWLIMLPWCMRVVWRSLFWVGDGGWTREPQPDPVHSEPETSPTSPWDLDLVRSAIESAKAANTSVALPLPNLLMPFSHTLNMTAGEPTVWAFMKRFFFNFAFPLSDLSIASLANATDPDAAAAITEYALGPRNPSLLSNVAFFNWFPSQVANRFLVDVVEGQLITLLVVVAFILIFLIREWVVQQQPVINMVALGDDVAANRDQGAVEEELEHDVDDREEAEEEEDEVERVPNDTTDDVLLATLEDRDEPIARRDDRPRRSSSAQRNRQAIFRAWQNNQELPEELRMALRDGTTEDIARIVNGMSSDDSVELQERLIELSKGSYAQKRMGSSDIENRESSAKHQGEEAAPRLSGSTSSATRGRSRSLPRSTDATEETGGRESPSSLHRPNMPSRDRSFIATEIRRSLEEGNTWSFANAPVVPEEESQQSSNESVPDSWEKEDTPAGRDHDAATSDHEQNSEHSSESWQQVPDTVTDDNTNEIGYVESSQDKGKGRAVDGTPESSLDEGIWAPPTDNNGDALDPEVAGYGTHAEIPVSGTNLNSSPHESEAEEHHNLEGAEVEPEREPVRPVVQPPPRLMDRVLDWLFGDIAPGTLAPEDEVNDEHVVQDLEHEAPFVPFAGHEPREAANPPIQDPEVAAAAAQAGIDLNDQDAIDDAEDLEGIMELIGMQGPLTGLFQNAMFSAVLISATLACAVWLPYLWGKVVLLLVGSPISLLIKLPLQIIATLADLVVDAALCIGAGVVYWGSQFIRYSIKLCSWGTLSKFVEGPISIVGVPARSVAESAMGRIAKLVTDPSFMPRSEDFRLSVNSHVALRTIQNSTSYAMNQTGNAVAALYEDVIADPPSEIALRIVRLVPGALRDGFISSVNETSALASWVWNSKPYQITLDFSSGGNTTDMYTTLEHWTATDRVIAVFAGYAFFAIVGAIYLKRDRPFSSSQQGRKVEGIITEILQQAGGVLKVILIISIEMLAFPLYCGLLLDLALLPLFQDAGLKTRWQFTHESPWTSGFVHWFIGTCYMFHFALFVSMCRKILRKGVLYFIRDPDDPTFHPVRDVLERSVTTQLRKIAFSGLVYGGLVIVCMGGVVWGLKSATRGVLPIQWSSQTPSLEFPLDLLFYNFLTPVIIRLYKPSDVLQVISEWWFKACARFLRLSNFLFGEKVKEEEGHHVRRTWSSWLSGEKGNPEKPVIGEDRKILAEDRGTRVYFMFDGKYVRAPASDSVRIPKGEPVFVEVDQAGVRKDGKPEEVETQSSETTMVYIPPWFRLRIALFVITIWLFAAVTGISVTIVPLLFGRYLFSVMLPAPVEMNDIHAFSLGIYSLGTTGYGIYHVYKFISSLNQPIPSPLSTLYTIAATTSRIGLRVLRFAYVWTSLLIVIPFLFALVIELFFLMPLHAYLGPKEPHVVHLIQDWTLGFLYARLAARLVFSNRNSRAARAFHAVIAGGYLNPNARIATKCFLLPVAAIFTIAIACPAAFAFTLNKTVWLGASDTTKSLVWRFSFPLLGVGLVAVWVGKEGISMLNRWRMVVRDEVYLIGERLHNFGERKAPPVTVSNAVMA
jgi:E3 ubiquitin-protein ligase MARCH6